MKKNLFTAIIITLLIAPLSNFAGTQTKFIEGQQYKSINVIASNPSQFKIPKNKILVVEFFSYGCPSCFKLEPTIEKWLKTKPNYVEFKRVSVDFEPGWQMYSKAYYTAKTLGVLEKITPALFHAIQVKGEDLTSDQSMQTFFAANGINKREFKDAFDYSPGISMELQRSKNLMTAYHVSVIPTIVINGKYYTNIELAKGNDQLMIQVLNFLIAKEKKN